MESLEGRKSTVTVEISGKDSKQGTLIINIPETRFSSVKKTNSVKFNKISPNNSLADTKRSSEKNIKQFFEGASKKPSDGRTESSDKAANKSSVKETEKLSDEAPRSCEDCTDKPSKEMVAKTSGSVKKGLERAFAKLSGRIAKKCSEGSAKTSSAGVSGSFEGEAKKPPKEGGRFSHKLSANCSTEQTIYRAAELRNSDSFLDENSNEENSKRRETPTRLILGLFIVLAIALWYGVQNGRFKLFLTPALRGFSESESTSACDDASIRHHDVLPFDAEPYDDPDNQTE